MRRRLLGIVLSVLMAISSFGTFVYAADDAQLAATDWTQTILSVKANTLAGETKNYSSKDTMWDPQTEYQYLNVVSFQGSNDDGNKDYGAGSPVFYIGNWSIGEIPAAELGGKFYVGMLVRTNSASTPMYNPLNFTGTGSKQVSAATPFAGNGEWEFNSIDFELPTTLTSFKHGHLKFGTEAGKYIDVAAWGLFATSVSKADAEAALKNASKVSEADIVTTSLADEDGNIVKAHLVGAVTLPDYEDTDDSIFAGWTETKGSYTVVAEGGASYTPTKNVILYPVYKKNVRFVNGSAATNGDGMTAETAYNTFAQAAADLNASGGTIVVCGETNNFSLKNTGDIVITSVYDGVDYRETNNAKLNFGSSYNYLIIGYVDNPGKVTLENLTTVHPSADGWHLMGHDMVIRDSVKSLTSAGSSAGIQLMAVCSSNATPPASIPRVFSITVDNTYNSSIILGPRREETIAGADITINGQLGSLAISNNTYEKYDWLNTSPGFGQLTVNGDIKITVNGKLTGNIYSRKHVLTADSYDYGLKKIVGNIATIVNYGGTYAGSYDDIVKARTEGKWLKITGIQGTTLAYGENADDIVLTLDDGLDYNFVNLTNTTTENTYAYFIENGTSEFTLPESGIYTMTLSKNESKTVSFVDEKGGNTVEDMTTIAGLGITLPKLSNTDLLTFLGWSDTEGSEVVKYKGGDTLTVSGDITLYAIWEEADSYTVKFMNGDVEFASYTGIEGKTIKYPEEYPSKAGYYFTGWDSNPTVIGTEDITLNATFKTAEEIGYHVYYWNGSAAVNGDGTYEKPFQLMSTLVTKLNETGGVVVCIGKCNMIYQPRLVTAEDVTFTALDPLTGKDFGGDFDDALNYTGGHIYMPATGTYWGGATYQTGAIIFENIDILNASGQYGIGHWTFDGHAHVIGENVRHMAPETGKEIGWFLGGTSTNNASKPHIVKGIYKSPVSGSNWLARGGGQFEIDKVEYDSYAKSSINLAHDSADVITINGPVLLTYYEGSTGSSVYHSRASYAFGAKAYASIILNDGVTISNKLDVTAEKGIDGKVYIINSDGGTVTHTDTRGTYHIESSQYNYAKVLDSDGDIVKEAIIVDGIDIALPDYGTYTVEYSNKSLYSVEYVTSPYDSICPKPYAVTSEETDKHTITLPTLNKQSAHSFEGWTTVENGTTAEYAGGAEYTLNGETTMYAVWKEIPTFTVTFKDDEGNELHKATGYAGAPMTFPENNPYRYGQKLLGYAYEGTSEIIAGDAVIPEGNKTALPVWGEIPVGETRLYVNASQGNDENTGTSPDKALKNISKAVELLKNDGGYIIVTGGSNVLSKHWNNSGDITLTSLDPVSGIDYRAEISEDGLSFTNGAYITYGYAPFGYDTITGKITINNVILLNTTNNEFLCMNGHPFEIGKGISSYQQKSSDEKIAATTLNMRALGEGDSNKTNPEGIIFTINDLDNGALRVFAIGKASNTVSGIDITVDSDFNGTLLIGNDSLGGTATVNGDVKLTVNGKMKNSVSFTGMTNPINGNVYVVAKNGSNVNVDAIKQADGVGKYIVNYCDGALITHGENGTFEITADSGITDKYLKIIDKDGNIVDYLTLINNKTAFTPKTPGNYNTQFTSIAMRKLSFVTGDESIVVPDGWYEENSDVEIKTDLYRYGYIFKGWSDGTNTYSEGLITMPNENVTLTAIWENAPKYRITFDANGSDIAVPGDIYEYEGENVVLPKVATASGTFAGWSEDKNATTGALNHVAVKDTTLYAITTDGPVYVVDSYYRGDPNNYTGTRNSFRRYVIDVYLENAVASEGSFKLNTDNKFLYYLGHVPQEGINATVTASVISGSSGTPGLQYYTTPSVEFKWTSDAPVDTTNGRIRIARIMMYFSSWGMGYNQIEARTTDEVVSPFAGYNATADNETAFVTANFYKGVKSDEVKINGKITLEGRESGNTALYDSVKLYLLDDSGDAVEYRVLENAESTNRTFTYTAEIAPGDYTIKVIKDGYLARSVPITVTQAADIPEIVVFSGDTLDSNGKGDGVIDIDDFTRILRGFASDFPLDKYINAIDINEDGAVNVSDLAIIKNRMTTTVRDPEFASSVDKSELKLSDWKISVEGNKINVIGGSDAAVANALSHIENMYGNNGVYRIPSAVSHTEDYAISYITLNGVSLGQYRIVIAQNDETAAEYAQYIYDYIAEMSGFGLDIVYDTEDAYDYEILVGATSRKANPITAIEEYNVFEENGKLYVFYGDEQSAEMAALDLCEKILGKDSEGYDEGHVAVVPGASYSGSWSVLSRFGVMSDSHVGARYNWANYNWLHNAFTNFENAHASDPLDFIVSLGDNIDDGYANTYASDYAVYLEEIKELDICDPVNPIDGRAEGMIPHYEICGNHDPVGTGIGGQEKIRFIRNKLWYTENENGEKVAHIAYFTDYGGYPLHDYAYSGTYASYFSYGRVNDQMVRFVEESIIAANAEGAKHIILYNHYGMSQQVGSPMLPETGLGKIASVCEKYGIKLYFNGHEHDVPYTLRRYNDIYDYDVSMTAQKHAIVEITTLRAKVTIYNSADNSIYREDIVPLSGRGTAKQTYAK